MSQALKKLWGSTRCVVDRPGYDEWVASIVKGGYSSRHYHSIKSNEFRVLSGLLVIRIWEGEGPPVGKPAEHTLAEGMSLTVPPKVWHQFLALSDVELVEVYLHPAGTPLFDIVRHDEGGVLNPPTRAE